jgi:hypothetical protein
VVVCGTPETVAAQSAGKGSHTAAFLANVLKRTKTT